jgi:hypothetical protein
MFCLSRGVLKEITGKDCGWFWIGLKTTSCPFTLVFTGSEHSDFFGASVKSSRNKVEKNVLSAGIMTD